uniref:NADH-ubiquinone oxidoreductase chain 6 n=1 Tax=Prolachesilla sp. GRAspLA TaxID=2597032 RepID=A0A8K1ZFJ2_9NEOP|nr:NADH dehydrogenase subunit 6 [Prolachesilla sp. GRAspLA]
MLIMMILIMMLTILFFLSKNPLSMGLILILQTISLSLMMELMQKSFWFLYILILIFIGGMLIMFIYMTSIFPNEKFFFNQKYLFMMIMMISIIMIFMYMNNFFHMNFPIMELSNFLQMKKNSSLLYTIKIFNSTTNMILIFLVLYLFYCMIIIIKIINIFKGPLRKMNYV